MKFSALGVTLMAATFAVATPAFAKHTGHKAHHAAKTAEHHQKEQKADKGSEATDDLNARSLQQAQTPVPATAPAAPPVATPTAPAPAPMDSSMKMPASTMPAPAGQ